MTRPRFLPLLLVAVASACGRVGDTTPAAAPSGSGPIPGPTATPTPGSFHYVLEPGTEDARTSEGAVYEAALRDEMGPSPPHILYILDRICADAGHGTGADRCDEPIDPEIATDLALALGDTVHVEYVPEERNPAGPSWMVMLGPVDIQGHAAEVGIAYSSDAATDTGVLVKLERREEGWVVTGSEFLTGIDD